jgi:hypothetical protein
LEILRLKRTKFIIFPVNFQGSIPSKWRPSPPPAAWPRQPASQNPSGLVIKNNKILPPNHQKLRFFKPFSRETIHSKRPPEAKKKHI